MQDTRFIPPVGHLMTRAQISDHQPTRFDICYRDDGRDPNHLRIICSIFDDAARPNFGTLVETMRADIERTRYRKMEMIHLRTLTEDGTIRFLRNSWGSNIPFKKWLREVLELPDLAESEKERFRQAYPNH